MGVQEKGEGKKTGVRGFPLIHSGVVNRLIPDGGGWKKRGRLGKERGHPKREPGHPWGGKNR